MILNTTVARLREIEKKMNGQDIFELTTLTIRVGRHGF